MPGRLRFAAPALALIVAVIVSGCGGRPGSVEVAWRGPQGAELRVDPAPKNASVYATTILVTNDTNETIRAARIRFRPTEARNAPAGFTVGTVTNVKTAFEGMTHYWAIGDLEPGAKVAVPLGLWFSLESTHGQAEPIELTISLVSPDLATSVRSNTLKVLLP